MSENSIHSRPLTTSSSQRPSFPAYRPHTVHTSTQLPFADFDQALSRTGASHTQSSPYPLSVLLENNNSNHTLPQSSISANISDFPAYLAEDLPYETKLQRRLKRVPLRLVQNFATTTEYASSSFAAEQAPSLTRRFSKKYKQRMADLRENIAHYASAPSAAAASLGGRIRRSSVQSDHATIHPSSPSFKRNGKHGDDRPKKLRTFPTDRNDTPAPIFGGSMLKQQVRMPSAIFTGGEGARQAAARYNACGGYEVDMAYSQEDIHSRRARVASLSSAADSGADLTLANDSPIDDEDGDVCMGDGDSDLFPDVDEPKTFDPLQYLPDEIGLQIFEMLDAPCLSAAMRVNQSWNRVANHISIWRKVFLRKWGRVIYTDPAPVLVGGAGTGIPNQPNQAWKDMYKARKELEANWRRGAANAGKATYLSGHTDSVYCVQFDEEKIITGSRDRTIRVWDINTHQCIRVIGGPLSKPTPGPRPLRTVDYPSFHSAISSTNGSVYGNSIFKVPSQWHDASILCLQYDDKILVTGSSDSDLLVWDVQNDYEVITRLKKHNGGVLDVALDADHIVSCSKDSRIIVWCRKTYQPLAVLSGHRGPVNAVQLRGNLLVSASGDGIARLWDVKQHKLLKEFSAKERGLAAVEFSEDMKYVLAGGNDHITYKFEVATGNEVATLVGHTQLVRSLWLDSANNRVVSGSYDLDLRVYDFVTGEQIWHADEWTTSWMLAAKSDYRRIVATSQDGRILIIDFGLLKGGVDDGQLIKNVEKLRAVPLEKTSAIIFRNPWAGPNESKVIYTR